jgi:hypothetical protein
MTPSKRFLIISLLIIFLSSVLIEPALAAGRKLEVQIPGLTTTTLPALPDYIKAIYEFSLMAVGIICLGALIYGGFRYLTSVGSPTAISDAKDQIFSALLGLIILFSAWLILNTINPELVILNPTPGGGCTQDPECPPGNVCDVANKVCVPYSTQINDWLSSSTECSVRPTDACESDVACKSCPLCSGTSINKWGADKCVKTDEDCGYTCVVGQCGATAADCGGT